MRPSNHQRIRQMLLDAPDGLTAKEISGSLGTWPKSIRDALQKMPDVYIDRWQKVKTATGRPVQWEAIWCAVEVPEDCPHPTKGKT